MTKDLTSLSSYEKSKRKFKKRVKRNQTVTETYQLHKNYKIYRNALSKDIFQFYMRLKEEQKSYRKSLQTTDKELAEQLAEDLYFDIKSKIKNGEQIFSLTAKELVEKFLEHQKKRVNKKLISSSTVQNKKTHLMHYLRFVSATQTINNIDANKFNDYLEYRQKQVKNITNVTVLNELTTIKSMYEFARKERLIAQDYFIKYEEFKVNKRDTSRDAYTIEEYERLISFSKNIYKHQKRDEDIYYCHLIHLMILILSNTGMRFSELHQLQYKNIKTLRNKQVSIKIDKMTTKVRIERTIRANTNVNDYINRIKKLSKFKSKESYLFSSFRKDTLCDKTMLYRAFKKVKDRVATKYSDDEFDISKTLYCLRHMFISMHLRKKVNAYNLAKFCGTSLNQIQMTYDAMRTEVASQEILDVQKSVTRMKDFDFTNFD